MDQRHNRSPRKRHLKPEHDVKEHCHDCEQHRDGAATEEVLANGRADKLHPSILDGIAECGCQMRPSCLDGGLLCLVPARLPLDSHQKVGLLAKLLDGDLAETGPLECAPHLGDLRYFRNPNFDQDPAAEVDPEVEPDGHVQHGGRHDGHDRPDHRVPAQRDDLQRGVVRNQPEPHDRVPLKPSGPGGEYG